MKISFKYENKDFKKYSDFVNEFIKLLQREFPLKNDLRIIFLNQKKGEMSTGSRRSDNVIKVLVGDRMNRDIMRTLAHEWVHEHQMDVLKRKKGPDIGGRNEDEANAFAGRLIKIFEKENPDFEPRMYEYKSLENKLTLIRENIKRNEKSLIKESLITEMKKIGIDKLPYSYSSLQKFIDSKTMDVHYNKHYKGYVDKLNKALENQSGDMELEEIIKSISKFDNTVRNNAGGAFNHALFWKMLSPKKQIPKGEIYDQIKKDFGNIKKMKDEFNQAAKDRFGSGWAWLYLSKDGKLKIMSTPNQDNPLMNVVKKGGFPILGLDVWEHAYYLKYQNKRDEYINNFWDVVNWKFVNDLYLSKLETSEKKSLNENTNKNETMVSKLCRAVKSRGKTNSPFCELEKIVVSLNNKIIEDSINESLTKMRKFFSRISVGVFPMIIKLSLTDVSQIANFLKLVADFIEDERFDNEYTKKVLRQFKNKNIIPKDLEAMLDYIRFKEHEKHELRFTDTPYFTKKATKLELNYNCGDDAKDKIIQTLHKIRDKKETLNFNFFRITKCLTDSFKNTTKNLKSDMEVAMDLKKENGDVMFPKGSFLEAKNMDYAIDSYLSEFFSIFKQSNLKNDKPLVIDIYNELINKIFIWLQTNQNAKSYLDSVRNKISGMVYSNDIIIPIEYIELYWSNKGQRGCDEKRLSIRFRIKPEYNKVEAYKFVDKDILESVVLDIPQGEKKLIICPTT